MFHSCRHNCIREIIKRISVRAQRGSCRFRTPLLCSAFKIIAEGAISFVSRRDVCNTILIQLFIHMSSEFESLKYHSHYIMTLKVIAVDLTLHETSIKRNQIHLEICMQSFEFYSLMLIRPIGFQIGVLADNHSWRLVFTLRGCVRERHNDA